MGDDRTASTFFGYDAELSSDIVCHRQISANQARQGLPSAPLIFMGAADSKYTPSRMSVRTMPSRRITSFSRRIKCTAIGASSGPTVCPSLPSSLIFASAKTLAAASVTVRFPFRSMRSAALLSPPFFRFFAARARLAFSKIFDASSAVRSP